jgi:adenylylsulfate kinase
VDGTLAGMAFGRGCVIAIWLTGLPCSGKTTLAGLVARELRRSGRAVEVLDGDAIRATLSPDLGFSKEDRDANVRRIAYVSSLLSRNGITTVVAAVSPYRAARDSARAAIEAEGAGFVEVHVSCPLEELVRRDVKGLYRRALQGEIAHFTGVSDPYEAPLRPERTLHTDRESQAESLARVMAKLEELGYALPVELARA